MVKVCGVGVATNISSRTKGHVPRAADPKECLEQWPVRGNGSGDDGYAYLDAGPDDKVDGGEEEVRRNRYLVDRFDADQSGNASNVCKAQKEEDGNLGAEVHVQATDKEGGKNSKGPVSDRRDYCMGIREPEDDFGTHAVTLQWIPRRRPEECGRLTLRDNLADKCNAEKARKGHDGPDNPVMQTFCSQAKQHCASSEFGEGGGEAVEDFTQEPHLEDSGPKTPNRIVSLMQNSPP